MLWDEAAGKVTRAFDYWKATDRDIRAYLALSARWADRGYQELWKEAEREFSATFAPDRHLVDGHVDLFHEKVHALWPPDYFWKLRSDNLRDAVTAFEVYMEKSLNEALASWVLKAEDGTRFALRLHTPRKWASPRWEHLVEVHRALDTDIEPEPVKYVRALRHLLVHQRGELRTEQQREKFRREADSSDWGFGRVRVGGDIPLASARVIEMLDDLGRVVRTSDAAAWAAAYGSEFPAAFGDLVNPGSGPLVTVPCQ